MAALKASISFGLVYIPVSLQLCVKEKNISFNLIDKKTHSRIRYIKTCDECDGKEVEQKDIVKGYEYEDGKYVLFDDKDFEKIKTARDKSITISQFVKLSEIEPIYYNKPYYVIPTGGEKAFSLLYHAMQSENKVGIAKFVFSSKEKLVALRAKDGQMFLYTMYFADEITKNLAKDKIDDVGEKELQLAKTLIDNMTEKFLPESFTDEYLERVKAAIEEKISGNEIKSAKEPTKKAVANLMDALELSLQATVKGKAIKKKAAAKKTTTVKKTQKDKTKSG